MVRPLGQLVAARRRRLKLSLREVAEKSSGALSFQTVHAIEEGRTNIGTDKLDALADVLGLPREVVREAAGRDPALGPFWLPVEVDSLDREERETVLAVVRALLRAKGKRNRGTRTRKADG